MRPIVRSIIDQLLESSGEIVELDAVGNAIGSARVSIEEIEVIFTAIEAAGRSLGDQQLQAKAHLPSVIAAARRIEQEAGRRPTLQELSAATQLSLSEVKAALLFASVLGR